MRHPPYQVEPLERRRLLSAGNMSFDATSGVLRIDGTARADVLQISRSGNTLFVEFNSATSTRDARRVRRLEVRSGGGNDFIVIGTTVDTQALLWGGPGSDLLRGGSGEDRLFGEGGDDRLAGNAGDDSLSGGGGRDQLRAGA